MGAQAMTRMGTRVLFDLVERLQSNARPILVDEYQTRERNDMSTHAHQTAPTQFTYATAATQYVQAGATRFAYRRMGRESGAPLLFMQNFRQSMDSVDPLLLDGFGQDRPVIIFDNAGVSSSSGETPDTIEAMADDVASFVGALESPQVDVLGFSIGGYTAIAFTLRHPRLVRRLLLVGTAPRGQEPRNDASAASILMRRLLNRPRRLNTRRSLSGVRLRASALPS